MYYTQEQIDRANHADLVSFLQSQGEQLTRAGNEYRWKRHDSLTVRGNKWYRHSQSKGGAPIDFVMEFYGKSFTEAVELLTGEKGAVQPPDRPSPAPLSDFRLPPRSSDNSTARNYLTATRRIDEDVSGFFFSTGDIYEEAAHHNAVFVGRDEDGVPLLSIAALLSKGEPLPFTETEENEPMLTKEEYASYKAKYTKQAEDIRESVRVLKEKLTEVLENRSERNRWISQFTQFSTLETLDRRALIHMVQSIRVRGKKELDITFTHEDEYKKALQLLALAAQQKDYEQRTVG